MRFIPTVNEDSAALRGKPKEIEMSLMIRARAKATAHLWSNLNLFRGHRIWRLYRWFGFDTLRVFCSCGKEFE